MTRSRRSFITLLGSAAAAWPVAARAQNDRRRHLGILMPYPEGDAEARTRIDAFRKKLATAGWSEDRNLQIDYRWVPRENDQLLEAALGLLGGENALSEVGAASKDIGSNHSDRRNEAISASAPPVCDDEGF